jgi:hypothetical protein
VQGETTYPGDERQVGAHARKAVVALPRREAGTAGPEGALDVVPQVRESVDILTDSCGTNVTAIVFFGSVLVGTSPTQDSAADLFVIVEEYKRFYRDLGSRFPAARSAGMMSALNRALPPNVIYLRNPGDLRAGAKCFIVSRADFAYAMSSESRDLFCRGRLTQRVQIVYARSEEAQDEVEQQLEGARRSALEWVPLYLPPRFDTFDYCFRMLEVSYGAEIRPEARSRVREVFEAQKTYFLLMFERLLEEGVADGTLKRVDGKYALAENPTRSTRLRWKCFFVQSKMRATLRWGKYMLTFEDWLDYIARKTERRTGVSLELTKAERRFPALLLWPKLLRVLKAMHSRDEVEDGDDSDGRKRVSK